uniref:GB1/RHD3-type G domain-containing protein n=1 Tax=Anolis carolinensis TaxID=28377 RepID=A0A803T2Q6_ANOCA
MQRNTTQSPEEGMQRRRLSWERPSLPPSLSSRMSEPLCLVSPLLGLNRAALAHLRALPGPLLLLGVWGPRGTGKSFLLDQLAGRGTGFGPTPGLWLRWLPHPTRPGTMLVLLDSEGLQEQSEGGEGVSSGLFCLSVLLCTVFVFNSRGAEEPQRELDRLSGCLEGLLRRVRVLEDCPQENSFLLSSVLPEFVWCLRDAAPDCLWDELLRATGHDMGTLLSSSDESEDSPGRSIQRLFPSQKAFCFRPPTLDESERELFPSEKTHPVFQKQLGAFKDYVLSREPRAGVSGEVLCSRLQRFVGALSRDQPILLSETFQSWGAAAPGSTWEEEAEERFLAAEPPRAAPVVEEIPRGSEAHIWGAQEEEWPEEEREGNRWRDPGPGEAVEELDFQPPLGPRAASPAPLPVAMEAPICLIENGPRQPLRINAEALRILQRIHQPVVVVAIVGLYRTGKSYLMNRLAGRGAGGFSLGATVQANTKGIWMWCLPHPLRADQALVLLDTEGLGDVEKSNTENDSWIFALSVLLSSTFVYNSMGTINHYALEQMQYPSGERLGWVALGAPSRAHGELLAGGGPWTSACGGRRFLSPRAQLRDGVIAAHQDEGLGPREPRPGQRLPCLHLGRARLHSAAVPGGRDPHHGGPVPGAGAGEEGRWGRQGGRRGPDLLGRWVAGGVLPPVLGIWECAVSVALRAHLTSFCSFLWPGRPAGTPGGCSASVSMSPQRPPRARTCPSGASGSSSPAASASSSTGRLCGRTCSAWRSSPSRS